MGSKTNVRNWISEPKNFFFPASIFLIILFYLPMLCLAWAAYLINFDDTTHFYLLMLVAAIIPRFYGDFTSIISWLILIIPLLTFFSISNRSTSKLDFYRAFLGILLLFILTVNLATIISIESKCNPLEVGNIDNGLINYLSNNLPSSNGLPSSEELKKYVKEYCNVLQNSLYWSLKSNIFMIIWQWGLESYTPKIISWLAHLGIRS